MLNSQQKKAIETTEGFVLILAGAGSGKTRVLVHRIAYLIETLRVPPSSILGLTFTNKAAQEMRERVSGLLTPKLAKEVTLSTFHSFCMQVLRREITHLGYTRDFSLYDEQDVKRLAKELARQLLEHEGDLPSVEPLLAKISYIKSRGGVLDGVEPFTKDLYTRLQTCMRAYNAVDFDSLLSLTLQLFEQFPEVLQKYQERFRYIMIDEYQDTNAIQYRLAKLLSDKHNNLCVVGDDDQAIYSWRGAEVKNILEFEATTKIKLEENYRSSPAILNAAHALISKNTTRHDKQIFTSLKEGEPITVFHAPDEWEEAQAVVQRILHLRKQRKLRWGDFAILYRSNILSRTFELALMQAPWEKDGTWYRGIPFEVFGGTEFYERSEIKDLIAYLRVIVNPLDQEALLRIINVPRRGVSDQALDHLTQLNRSQNVPLWNLLNAPLPDQLSDKATKGIHSFIQIIEEAKARFEKKPLHASLKWLLEKIDYQKAISEEVKSDKMQNFKWENVCSCVDALERYEEEQENPSEVSLHHFLTTTLLDRSGPKQRDEKGHKDCVHLMTFHSAKGLEFEACYLVGLEDHLIPHEKSLAERGLEEERRLLYVAMTRAKRHLTMSMARKRKRMGREENSNPSRFLFDIPPELFQTTSWKTIN